MLHFLCLKRHHERIFLRTREDSDFFFFFFSVPRPPVARPAWQVLLEKRVL